jgi:hypothetical protein
MLLVHQSNLRVDLQLRTYLSQLLEHHINYRNALLELRPFLKNKEGIRFQFRPLFSIGTCILLLIKLPHLAFPLLN